MNLFVIFWSAIGSGCLSLVGSLVRSFESNWYPGYPNLLVSAVVYLAYWLLLGILQAFILYWKFQDRQFSYRWLMITSIVGFLVMLSHDVSLKLLNVDTRGQGILILLISLPCLAALGGFILGLAQFFCFRKYYKSNISANRSNLTWFAISFVSWFIGFAGIFWGNYMVPATVLLTATGGALKGWFLQKYLRV